MARDRIVIWGLNPGRYKGGIRAQVVQFGYLNCDCFKGVLILKIKCSMVSGFDLISERAKCIESD